jgi:hypothetical protein
MEDSLFKGERKALLKFQFPQCKVKVVFGDWCGQSCQLNTVVIAVLYLVFFSYLYVL